MEGDLFLGSQGISREVSVRRLRRRGLVWEMEDSETVEVMSRDVFG